MFEEYTMLSIGRFVQGIACGIHLLASTRFIEECCPSEKLSFYLPLYFVSISSARFIVLLIGTGMPNEDDLDEMQDTGYWRFVIGYALFLYILFFLAIKLIIHHDSIKYHIMKGQTNKAIKAIKNVYKNTYGKEEEILEHIKEKSHLDTLRVSYRKAVISHKYRRGTLVLIVLSILHQITGYQPINVLSRYLFRDLARNEQTILTLE